MPRSILIIDDHPLTAEGLQVRLQESADVEVSICVSLQEARARMAEQVFDVLVIDLFLPDGDGIEFFESLSESPKTCAVLLSGLFSDADIQRAVNAGFAGIITKNSPIDTVVESIEAACNGETAYSPDVAPVVANLQGGDLFTPRMIEVLSMLKDGLSNKQIAGALDISEATVSFHVNQLKLRLGARTNRQIVAQAGKLGISLTSSTNAS